MKHHRHRRSLQRWLAALVVLVALVARGRAASASPALDAANHSFAEGHFEDATAQYEAILAHDGYSAPVLFDLGNAYLRQDKPALAMLAYERARLLAPRDHAIASNLAKAREAAGLAGEPRTLVHAVQLLSFDEWTWLAVATFWLAMAAAGAALAFRRPRAWLVRAAALSALVSATSVAAIALASGDRRAALALEPTPVLVSPFAGAQSSAALRPGAYVHVSRVHDGYVLVRDRSGHEGWVERSAVAPIVPDGATFPG